MKGLRVYSNLLTDFLFLWHVEKLLKLSAKYNQRESNSRLIIIKRHPNSSVNKDFYIKNSKIALNLPLGA